MNVTEDQVRQSLLAHEAEAPDDSGLLSSVRAGIGRRRRLQWARAAGVAAAVVAVVVAANLVVHDSGDPRRPVTPATTSAVPVPPGMQPVSYHGVTVFVPASWRMDALTCGKALEGTVIVGRPGATPACLVQPTPQVSVVTLEQFTPRALAEARTFEPWDKRRVDVRVFDDVGVLLSARSLDEALVRRVLDSARVTPIDHVGCRDRVWSLQPGPRPGRPGAEARLVPDGARAATICRYDDNWLARSVRVPPSQLAELTATFNSLPLGMSQPPARLQGGSWCAADLRRGFIVQFDYPAGDRLDVYVHISGCRDLSASNGARSTKINKEITFALVELAGYGAPFPNPWELR